MVQPSRLHHDYVRTYKNPVLCYDVAAPGYAGKIPIRYAIGSDADRTEQCNSERLRSFRRSPGDDCRVVDSGRLRRHLPLAVGILVPLHFAAERPRWTAEDVLSFGLVGFHFPQIRLYHCNNQDRPAAGARDCRTVIPARKRTHTGTLLYDETSSEEVSQYNPGDSTNLALCPREAAREATLKSNHTASSKVGHSTLLADLHAETQTRPRTENKNERIPLPDVTEASQEALHQSVVFLPKPRESGQGQQAAPSEQLHHTHFDGQGPAVSDGRTFPHSGPATQT